MAPGLRRFMVLLGPAALLGCAGSGETSSEPVLDASFGENELVVTVVGTGCTAKRDFAVVMESGRVTIVRARPDPCRKMPEPVTIQFSYAEVGLAPGTAYTLTNPRTSMKKVIRR